MYQSVVGRALLIQSKYRRGEDPQRAIVCTSFAYHKIKATAFAFVCLLDQLCLRIRVLGLIKSNSNEYVFLSNYCAPRYIFSPFMYRNFPIDFLMNRLTYEVKESSYQRVISSCITEFCSQMQVMF